MLIYVRLHSYVNTPLGTQQLKKKSKRFDTYRYFRPKPPKNDRFYRSDLFEATIKIKLKTLCGRRNTFTPPKKIGTLLFENLWVSLIAHRIKASEHDFRQASDVGEILVLEHRVDKLSRQVKDEVD